MSVKKSVVCVCVLGMLLGCAAQSTSESVSTVSSKAGYAQCPEQRSQICTREYRPVCADVAVQCITAPCPSVSQTYANGCEACSKTNVMGYVSGQCDRRLSDEKQRSSSDQAR